MQQNSDDWTEWRKKGIGSSDAPIVMGLSPWTTRLQLWEQKLGLSPGFQGNFATERGHQMEPKARAAFELEMGEEFPETLAVHSSLGFLRASLDGFNENLNAILEIKCPGKEDHDKAKAGQVPEKYMAQVQHQLLVTGAKLCYYYSYDGEKGVTVEVEPDLKYMEDMLNQITAFWTLVETRVPPELSDKDVVKIEDKDALELAKKYAANDKAMKKLKKENDDLKKEIVKLCTHARTKIGPVSVTRAPKEGSIDYKSIPELSAVELEDYRKKSTMVTTVRVGK